jgi:hypothetical protein
MHFNFRPKTSVRSTSYFNCHRYQFPLLYGIFLDISSAAGADDILLTVEPPLICHIRHRHAGGASSALGRSPRSPSASYRRGAARAHFTDSLQLNSQPIVLRAWLKFKCLTIPSRAQETGLGKYTQLGAISPGATRFARR